VDPAVALPKIRGILDHGGKLALIWKPTAAKPAPNARAQFESI